MVDFTPEQLRTLVAVIDEGTFDAAAARLHVTASAVSQRIKALEQAAGQVLVQRVTPVEPTEAGRHVLRHAREVALLGAELERRLASSGRDGEAVSIPIAVNADSLATWFLPALIGLGPRSDVLFDLRRDDQEHTAEQLRRGEVVAAVTSVKEPVQGAVSTSLGVMRYRAVCSPAYVEAHLGGVAHVSRIANAPVVDFDRKDMLQLRLYREVTGRETRAPRHFVPTSTDFARAVVGGLGWGLLPDQQCAAELERGELVRLGGARSVRVALYWQRWAIGSSLLAEVTDAVVAAARATLLRR
ncbi:LysR family transcriptional regulator ArgP [Gryllotalpicola ginsengisoli]|uniref:LysR family transcriptional regulator ArgP n=1 Tax=Gryllotalpicola ginsengisoli TaxID=444608 RepID=UPI0003B65C1D|nr:LysR family transcriptional regulator ArgP [Gryllotalpicola ginsengisoli]